MKIMENRWNLFILPKNLCSVFNHRMKRILVLLLFIFLSSAGTFAQQASVSGTVKDSQGNPITGATVLVKGTSYGTLTDIDGKYTVPTVLDNSILVFSFMTIGYD